MLRGSLVVHGTDLEKLARQAVSDAGLRLPWWQHEDLVAELIGTAWELSTRHDEARFPGQFPAGAYRLLRLRVIDWIRKTEGRTRWAFSEDGARRAKRRHTRAVEQEGKVSVLVERTRHQVLSLDAPLGSDTDSELGEAVAARSLDVAEHRSPDLGWALSDRRSEEGAPSEDERRRASRRARP